MLTPSINGSSFFLLFFWLCFIVMQVGNSNCILVDRKSIYQIVLVYPIPKIFPSFCFKFGVVYFLGRSIGRKVEAVLASPSN